MYSLAGPELDFLLQIKIITILIYNNEGESSMKRSYLALTGTAALLWTLAAQAAPTTDEKLDLLSEEVERLKAEIASQPGGQTAAGAGRTTIGGYGELHYNNLDSKKEIDFHRFVLFFGHKISDRIRFFSEFELEHALAGEGKEGEVELEQAYLEFDLTERLRAQGGLFLVPVGILNETHEPPTFYGVERNPVESYVVPSTWWEAGASLRGELGAGVSVDLAATSGLAMDTAWSVRNARQKVSEANADSLAYTGRLKWTGIPGLELATSLYYQPDMTQSAAGVSPVSGVLAEAHAVYSTGPFALRALYAEWTLNDDSATTGPDTTGQDEQYGWYVEPSVKLGKQWGLFARYQEWDLAAGKGSATDSLAQQTNAGINFWPHPQVVVKFDVQNQEGSISDDGYNLGIGYMF